MKSFRLRFFIQFSIFRLLVLFLETICMLQLRRFISGCGFSVSVNFEQFRCWIFFDSVQLEVSI